MEKILRLIEASSFQIDLENLALNLLLSVLVLLLTYILIKLGKKIIDKIFTPKEGQKFNLDANFSQSISALLKTLLTYSGLFLAILIILEIFKFRVISPEDLKNIGTKAIIILLILLGSKLAIKFSSLAIQHIFKSQNAELFLKGGRANTLHALAQSVVKYSIFFIAGIMILETFNVNTSALLASAGILGLAVGFGAQNLVKDIISGFFIIFEDQFSVGDYVEAGGVEGTVEEVGLRTTKIRHWTGKIDIIPNGNIDRVTNYNKGDMVAVVVVGIAYKDDIEKALEVLQKTAKEMYEENESIVEEPIAQGVTELDAFSVKLRVLAKTVAGDQWAVERELRKRIKNAFDEAGIEIPYTKNITYSTQNC